MTRFVKVEVPDDFDDEFVIRSAEHDETFRVWQPQYRKVLDTGFVGLVDFMGDDSSIVNAARVSYGKGTKKVNSDKGLIRYLMRHLHCYHPDMEVLTIEGWKKWCECNSVETFLVPNPDTRSYTVEELEVKSFDYDGIMYEFSNERMSYSVTDEHKMLFKEKYQNDFKVYRAKDMPKWGWFESMLGYSTHPYNGVIDDFYTFVGMFLGDGHVASPNRISFGFKKERKISFLTSLLHRLGWEYTSSVDSKDTTRFYITTPDELRVCLEIDTQTNNKHFQLENLRNLTGEELRGLLTGLVESDGNHKSDRHQISFSSTSKNLTDIVSAISPRLGLDSHYCRERQSGYTVNIYFPNGRTSLESRKQYHSTSQYTGSVYCATTSSGFLMVRGANTKYGFVSSNSTPFEMCNFKFHVKAPIFVFRQWHRHRTFCLSGDSVITFELPDHIKLGVRTAKYMKLSDLHRKWNENPPIKRKDKQKRSLRDFNRTRIRSMLLRVYDESAEQFTTGTINDVIYSGPKQVFEITLENGKTLKCSKDHQIYTLDGWQRLEDAVGLTVTNNRACITKDAYVMCNGIPAHQDFNWMNNQRNLGYSVQEIASNAGCSYHTIRKWLRIHGLQFSNGENRFKKGHKPWNKDVYGYSTNLVHSDDHISAIKRARSGENSNFWKGGITPERQLIGAWTTAQAPKVHEKFDYRCNECSSKNQLQVHHVLPVVDYPEHAYDFDNLVTLCVSCHRRAHGQEHGDGLLHRAGKGKGNLMVARPSKIIKIELIGIEDTYDICVEGPNHNFVANGMIVHNSINEYSARYSVLDGEMYHPDLGHLAPQSTSNRQGRSGDVLTEQEYNAVMAAVDEVFDTSYQTYLHLLGPNENGDLTPPPDGVRRRIEWCKEAAVVAVREARKRAADAGNVDPYPTEESVSEAITAYLEQNGVSELAGDFPGIARELARMVLPVATYSQMYWSGNLHNLFHFLKLRCDPHAQYEIRVFADAILELIEPHVPWATEAFRDYLLEGSQLSRMEYEVVRDLLRGLDKDPISKELKDKGCSQREITEFLNKFML